MEHTNEKLKLLSERLKDADENTFCFDSYTSGRLEQSIVDAQVLVMYKIGDMIDEILTQQE